MNKLKELRHQLGYTQKEMSTFLNVSISLYQKMEIGNKSISKDTIKILKDKENLIKEKVPYFSYKFFLEDIIT